MKSVYLIFIFVLAGHFAHSQFENLNPLTVEAKEFSGKIEDVIFRNDGSYILSVKQKAPTRVAVNGVAVNGYCGNDKYAIVKMNLDGKFVSGNILETKIDKLQFHTSCLLNFNNIFYSFGWTEKDGSNLIELFAYKVNEDSMRFEGEPIKLGEINGEIKKWGDENKTENLDAQYFEISISPDKNHLAVLSLKKYEKDVHQKFHLTIFDNQLNKTRDTELELNYADDDFRIDKMLFNNAGDVTVFGSHQTGKTEVDEPHLIIFPADYSASWDFKCTMSNILITGTLVQLLENGNIFFSGFYNNMNDMNQRGLFAYELNAGSKKIINEIYNPFDSDFQKTILTDKELLKGTGFRNYKINQVIQRGDGKYFLVAEMFYDNQFYSTSTYWTTSYSGMGTSTPTMHTVNSSGTTFTYRNSIVFSLDKNLKEEWKKVIEKKQSTAMPEKGIFSTTAFINEDKLVMMFNDNKLNSGATEGELKTFSGAQSTGKISVNTFNEDGSMTQSEIKLQYPSLLLTERVFVLPMKKLALSFLSDTPSPNGAETQWQVINLK